VIFRISVMRSRIYAGDHFDSAQGHQTMRRRKTDISSQLTILISAS
jgi:hypothetical protein